MTHSRFLAKQTKDLHRRVSQIIQEVRDPRIAESIVTLSSARLSSDLTVLSCTVAVQGSPPLQRAVISVLNRARGFVRRRLGEHLELKRTPEVRFFLDEGPARAARIDEILDRIGEDRPAAEPAAAAGTGAVSVEPADVDDRSLTPRRGEGTG